MEYIRRILVVGDEPEYSAIVLRHLKREAFVAEIAFRSDEARIMVEQRNSSKAPFDLVIIHSIARRPNGLDLLVWLQEAHPGVSIILVSSYGYSDETLGVLRPALDDYADTPLTPKQMMELINSVDRRRRCASVRPRKRVAALKSEWGNSREE